MILIHRRVTDVFLPHPPTPRRKKKITDKVWRLLLLLLTRCPMAPGGKLGIHGDKWLYLASKLACLLTQCLSTWPVVIKQTVSFFYQQLDLIPRNRGLVFVRSGAATQSRQLLFGFLIISLSAVYFIIHRLFLRIFAELSRTLKGANVVQELILSTPKQPEFKTKCPFLPFYGFDKHASYVNLVLFLFFCIFIYIFNLLIKSPNRFFPPPVLLSMSMCPRSGEINFIPWNDTKRNKCLLPLRPLTLSLSLFIPQPLRKKSAKQQERPRFWKFNYWAVTSFPIMKTSAIPELN